jgi:chloramphenicol O-acetyltransferase
MGYEIRKLAPFRLASIAAYEAVGAGHNMYALLELDVTGIRQRLRAQRRQGASVSFFGFLLSMIARTIDENRELNHIRCGKQIYCFDEVDISTAIELELDGNVIPRLYVVRDAAGKSTAEISQEIANARTASGNGGSIGEDDRWAQRGIKLASSMPKWLVKSVIRHAEKDPLKIKERFGTTYVASVGGFSDTPGFVLPFIEGQNRPLAFAIGNVVKKPGAADSEIRLRDYLSMAVVINHDLVDGAPAARFVKRLRQRIEGRSHQPGGGSSST